MFNINLSTFYNAGLVFIHFVIGEHWSHCHPYLSPFCERKSIKIACCHAKYNISVGAIWGECEIGITQKTTIIFSVVRMMHCDIIVKRNHMGSILISCNLKGARTFILSNWVFKLLWHLTYVYLLWKSVFQV